MPHNWIQKEYPVIEQAAPPASNFKENKDESKLVPILTGVAGAGFGCASLLITRKATFIVQVGVAAALLAAGTGAAIALAVADKHAKPDESKDNTKGDSAGSTTPPVNPPESPSIPHNEKPEELVVEHSRTSVYEIRDIFAEKKGDESSKSAPAPKIQDEKNAPTTAKPEKKFSNGKMKSFTSEFMPVIVDDTPIPSQEGTEEIPEDLKEALDDLAEELEEAINDQAKAEELDFDEFAADAVSNSEDMSSAPEEEVTDERAELIQNYREIFRNRK